MQTSQVSNAANALTGTSASNKQSNANAAAEPFGKVLSREVSQRNGANDAPKNKDAGSAAPAQQPAKTPSKASESKTAKEAKPADKAKPEDETTEAAAEPEDMLALVANLNELNAQATQVTDAQAQPPVQMLPATQAIAATATIPDTAPVDTAPTDVAALTGARQDTAALTTQGLSADADKAAGQLKQADVGGKADIPVEVNSNAAVKAEDLNAQASTHAKAQDFSSAMKESVNGVNTNMQPVQQAALNALQQQAANTAEKLTPRVGTPAWDQALGQKVVWMVAGEQQSASLTLNPPDLGPLQVVLNVSNSQANATFIAAQPEVRQALEAALPKLREMLGEAGIQLGQASVNSGTPNQQGSFDQQGSQTARGHGHSGNHETAGTDAQARVSRVQPASSGRGLVDTFV